MAKPLGIVAMLTLLITSGTALADDHLLMRSVSDIKVTNTSKIIFEMKGGGQYTGELQMCPIEEHVKQAQGNMLGVTPLTGRPFIREGTKVAFSDLNARPERKRRLGTCEITNLRAG